MTLTRRSEVTESTSPESLLDMVRQLLAGLLAVCQEEGRGNDHFFQHTGFKRVGSAIFYLRIKFALYPLSYLSLRKNVKIREIINYELLGIFEQ